MTRGIVINDKLFAFIANKVGLREKKEKGIAVVRKLLTSPL